MQVLAFQVYNNAHPNHDRNDARQRVRFKSPAAMADLGQNTDASEGMESTASPGRAAMGDGDAARHVASHRGGGARKYRSAPWVASAQSFPVPVVDCSLYDPNGYP